MNLDIIENSKKIISPFELDIFIPEKNIAIEYNGLYWHSEEKKEKNYHLKKTLLCEEKGIFLIHIFEDEWLFKREIVESRIKQILGLNNGIKINARDCEIKEIDNHTKNIFLEKFHILGKDKSTVINLGAFYKNNLISVMTFSHGNIAKGSKRKEEIFELNRFCSDYNYLVRGIAGKLLSHFKNNYIWKEIFSYCDRRWSSGDLYKKLGFETDGKIRLNYWYSEGVNRIHRFSMRKKKDEPKDIPEYILRLSEGYIRIWDCGNLKFNINNSK